METLEFSIHILTFTLNHLVISVRYEVNYAPPINFQDTVYYFFS